MQRWQLDGVVAAIPSRRDGFHPAEPSKAGMQNRDRLIADIYRGLSPNGCLLVVEKVLGEESLLNRLFIKYYYELKRRNGYSELEITQKREALENVLVPYKVLENRELLLRTGFRYVDAFFKWYNFSGKVAVKQ